MIMDDKTLVVTPEMTVLDVVSQHRETEKIFKRLEEETGSCVCCQGLFLSVGEAAERFGFDLERVLSDLNSIISDEKE
ncbi:MAG: hypothetical protein A4E70_02043 [Syntrophus sp. PtaU1.Bin005]|jgi:hypothetical protein|nr:MAG: hypothetical protein A4E69_01847 [Syntrophus sp. PtaB.Bin138]OPY79657.1 MAG: hypothetical protein A4E70_02043 [Syntrophus sp. PtaU1.Bin005]